MDPAGDRRSSILVGHGEHVPAGRGYVRAGRGVYLQHAAGLGGDGQVDQALMAFFVAPHDPARAIAGRQATAQTVALVRHRLGLDQPVLTQYWHFLARLTHGDLGYSYYNSEPVRSLIFTRLPVTLSLTLGGAVLWLLLGVSTGVTAARHPRSLRDRTATVFVLGGLSMPTFLVGLLLHTLFFRLHLAGIEFFPGGGYVPFTQSPLQWAQHLLLPGSPSRSSRPPPTPG